MEKRKLMGKLESHRFKRMELDYSFSPCMKINSKWVEDLNMRSETINYIKENIGAKFMDLGHREHFINLTSKVREIKA